MAEADGTVTLPVESEPVGTRVGLGEWLQANERLAWWLLAALALLARLVYLFQIHRTPFFQPSQLDPLFYFNWAREIAAGNWVGNRIFVQSPLYAYLLAVLLRVFGGSIGLVLLFQILVGVGTCLLTVRVGRRLLGNEEAWVAGILAAFYGPFLFYEGMVMKTFLSTFLTVALLDLLLCSEGRRARILTASGFVFALTSLVRDNFVLIFPLLLMGLAFGFKGLKPREAARACVFFTLGAVAGVLPVTLRNFAVGHEFALLTTGGGEVFYIGNNPDANGRYLPPPFVHADPAREHDDFIAKAGELQGRKLTAGESSSFWLRQGLSWIAENPGAWLRLLGTKFLIFWNSYELPDNYNYYEVRQVLLHPLSLPGVLLFLPLYLTFYLVAPLGLTGIFLSRRRWRDLLLVYLILFGYMGTVLLFFNFSRFRVPIVPFLCLFAGVTLVALFREVRTWVVEFVSRAAPGEKLGVFASLRDRLRRQPLLVVPPLFFAGVMYLVNNRASGGGRGVFPALQYHLSLGDTYRSQSRYQEAEKEYRLGLQILGDETMDAATGVALGADPGRIRQEVERERLAQGVNFSTVRCGFHYGLGALWVRQGQDLLDRDRGQAEELIRRGIQEIEQGVQVVPYPPHLKRLAEAYSLLGLTAEAEKAYRLALSLSESDFGLHYDLAGLLFQAGRFPEALAEMEAARKTKPRLNASELSDYHYGMGLLRLDGYRDRGKALFHLRKALDADPDHREKKRIREIVSDLVKAGVRPVPEE